MTIKETAMVIAYLREFFPQGKEVTQTTINAWHSVLKDYDIASVKGAAKSVAMTYQGVTMPPVALILQELDCSETEVELWRIAERWARRGTSMTQSDFDSLPKPIQAYFGGVSAFRDLAMMDAKELANERARFLKHAPKVKERIRHLELDSNILAIGENAFEKI